jgi:hypothetical protein
MLMQWPLVRHVRHEKSARFSAAPSGRTPVKNKTQAEAGLKPGLCSLVPSGRGSSGWAPFVMEDAGASRTVVGYFDRCPASSLRAQHANARARLCAMSGTRKARVFLPPLQHLQPGGPGVFPTRRYEVTPYEGGRPMKKLNH